MNHGWDYRVGLSVPPDSPPPETVQEVARYMLDHPDLCRVAMVANFGMWLDVELEGGGMTPLPYETA